MPLAPRPLTERSSMPVSPCLDFEVLIRARQRFVAPVMNQTRRSLPTSSFLSSRCLRSPLASVTQGAPLMEFQSAPSLARSN
jgi:hypothetical protein